MSALDEMAAFNKASDAKARLMRGRRFGLELTWLECLTLQDAVDDFANDGGAALRGAAAARVRALQSKLHALTGEEMPPTQSARRASLRRLLKVGAK